MFKDLSGLEAKDNPLQGIMKMIIILHIIMVLCECSLSFVAFPAQAGRTLIVCDMHCCLLCACIKNIIDIAFESHWRDGDSFVVDLSIIRQ